MRTITPPSYPAQASRLRQTLDAGRTGGVEYAFSDTAGRSDDSALNAARAADLVLVPNRPNIVQLETLPQVKYLLLRLAGNPPAFVLLNGRHPTAGRTTVAEVHDAISLIVTGGRKVTVATEGFPHLWKNPPTRDTRKRAF